MNVGVGGQGLGVGGDLRAAVADRTLVLKLGGSVGSDDTLPEDTRSLQDAGAKVVLVHGGGPLITSWLDRVGKSTRFVEGLRYTDEETLDVVRMVLSGLVNGEIVARLTEAGATAVGLSGSDDSLLVAQRRDESVGMVGDLSAVNAGVISLLLERGYSVVVAPVAVDGAGGFLNVNADTAAAEIAVALAADCTIFLTDVDGVSDGKGAGPLRTLSERDARRLVADGVISGGMIPKVQGCISARSATRRAQIIDGRRPHAVIEALLYPDQVGTTITV